MLNVLFVCTGNICRSPMAEGMLRAQADLWGIGDRLRVDSAGTTRWHEGEEPTREAQIAAASRGYYLGDLRSRPVTSADFDNFDWIICMTREHQKALRDRRRSADQAQILLATAFSPYLGAIDIEDPWGLGQAAYDGALDQLEQCCADILVRVRASVAA
ncbi:MAG: low molecular weight phosphotyrosine protein phosphatase [Alphaproteobacteria bacterium TMED89]|nr:phosphotyrosine protein phosphatase [Rhodospirillaceae bacterium]RPH10288.1 MAG: low molecular weight phosphotyrosine protein phosphatase [Alphaproteobacteria bacterium TMED89]